MKRNYLLVSLGLFMLTFTQCEKPHHDDCEENSCMHTVEYWRTHPDEWKLDVFGFGRGTYTKKEALVILFTPANGNHLVSVMQQLIALRLNAENGIICEEVGWAIVSAEDHLLMNTEEGQRIPPFGDAYSNSEDSKDLADDLRAINEGNLPASCCEEREKGNSKY